MIVGGANGPFILLASLVWLAALVDIVRGGVADTVGRLVLTAMLVLLPPAGVVTWLAVRRRSVRDRRAAAAGG